MRQALSGHYAPSEGRYATPVDFEEPLRSRRISAFPVLDDTGRVIGVVSEGDLLVKEAVQADGTSLRAALRHIREDDKAAGITAGDLMTGPAITIGPDAPVEEAAASCMTGGSSDCPS